MPLALAPRVSCIAASSPPDALVCAIITACGCIMWNTLYFAHGPTRVIATGRGGGGALLVPEAIAGDAVGGATAFFTRLAARTSDCPSAGDPPGARDMPFENG